MKHPFCRHTVAVVLAMCLFMVSACAPSAREAGSYNGVEAAFEKSSEQKTPSAAPDVMIPPEVSSALLPSLLTSPTPKGSSVTPADRRKKAEPRFDVSAAATPAREFFMSLVEGTPYSMVVHPRVAGEISLELKNATVPEVMSVVRSVYGYDFRRSEFGFQVLPVGLQTRTYHVNYLNLVRNGLSQTRVSSGQVSEADTSDSDSDDNDSQKRTSVSGSLIATESSADFWTEFAGALTAIVGNDEGRRVVVQPQAGVVVVRAMPDELREIENYLETIQSNLQRQVILEAKIVEVTLNDGYQAGINWASVARLGSGHSVFGGQTGGGSFFENGFSELNGLSGNLLPSNLIPSPGTDPSSSGDDGLPISAFGGVFSAAIDLGDFAAFIELLETQGDVQVLSSPRISTVNNQKAVIKVGSDEFFVTDISSDTVTGTTTTASQDITLTPFFSGIALDVTPQIDPTGLVTLHVHPTVSEVTDQSKTVTVGTETQVLPLAFSTIRESDTIVSARSGQVVVIGGLMRENRSNEKASVPFLGDIPYLGNFFSQKKDATLKSELVILLRPVVVDSARAWGNEFDRSRGRFEALGGSLGTQW